MDKSVGAYSQRNHIVVTQEKLPKVSIIVRTMGHQKLSRALNSARAQTWRNRELIVVAAKPDLDFTDADMTEVRLVASGARLLRPDAANAGLDAASGEWILFLDEDDWIDPTHIEVLWQSIAELPNILLAYSDMTVHKEGGSFVRSVGYWKQTFSDRPFFSMHPPLFSAELLGRGCRFDSQFELLEDWDFFLQCAEHTDFFHVPQPSAHYDPHSGTSGGGIGINRDDDRLRPFVESLTKKWGRRYAEITEAATACSRQVSHCLSIGDFREAKRLAEQGLVIDPGNPMLLNRLAASEQKLGDLNACARALRRACDSDRVAFRLRFELALIENRLGFRDRAADLALSLGTLARTAEEVRLAEILKHRFASTVNLTS